MNRSVRFLFGPVLVPAVRFLVLVPPVPVQNGAGSGLPVRTAALLFLENWVLGVGWNPASGWRVRARAWPHPLRTPPIPAKDAPQTA